MSEARKYHLNLIVANQFTTQLSEEIRDAVFGNMGTIVSFRVGQNDVEALSRYFKPIFDPDDLLRVPNYNAIVRTLINGVPTQPFSMAALPRLGTLNPKLEQALRQLSAAKFGKPRAIIDEEISKRMKTIEVPKPAFGTGGGVGARPGQVAPGQFGAPAQKATGAGSFLDEWLAKRRTNTPTSKPAAFSGKQDRHTANSDSVVQQMPLKDSTSHVINDPKDSTELIINKDDQSKDNSENTLHIDNDGNLRSIK